MCIIVWGSLSYCQRFNLRKITNEFSKQRSSLLHLVIAQSKRTTLKGIGNPFKIPLHLPADWRSASIQFFLLKWLFYKDSSSFIFNYGLFFIRVCKWLFRKDSSSFIFNCSLYLIRACKVYYSYFFQSYFLSLPLILVSLIISNDTFVWNEVWYYKFIID